MPPRRPAQVDRVSAATSRAIAEFEGTHFHPGAVASSLPVPEHAHIRELLIVQ
ncbi:hypothetical protein GCM10011609_17760 [Lentzea pudingi]|uniref:Uncharacterized protein n=1 Tax=Lentzea pudingi TaxID=1789439 RepID=A0ABQ2HJT5_9PSEU|nr:hypothetical protein [Lentzea pudingi]GGM82253.1 hypothetical protein GCM10011609_17760 [Lentzea pudingi]